MTKAEAIRILDPETSREALAPYRLDCELMQAKVEEACRVAVEAMRAADNSNETRNLLIMRNDELLKLREEVKSLRKRLETVQSERDVGAKSVKEPLLERLAMEK